MILVLMVGASIEAQPLESGRSSIALLWTAPGDDNYTGTASAYDLRYSTDSLQLANNFGLARSASEVSHPKAVFSDESHVVTDLASETVYFLAVKTADETGNWSPASNIFRAPRTDDRFPPAAIDDLTAEPGADEGDLDIYWSAVGDDSLSGTAVSYTIKIYSSAIDESNWDRATTVPDAPTPQESGQAESWTFSGLNPGVRFYLAVKAEDNYGNLSEISNIANSISNIDLSTSTADLPLDFSLGQNYPNPFNPATTINYTVSSASHVKLRIYNIQGQIISTLVDETRQPGHHSATWNGIGADGSPVATGVYLYRIQTNSYTETKKMVLLK